MVIAGLMIQESTFEIQILSECDVYWVFDVGDETVVGYDRDCGVYCGCWCCSAGAVNQYLDIVEHIAVGTIQRENLIRQICFAEALLVVDFRKAIIDWHFVEILDAIKWSLHDDKHLAICIDRRLVIIIKDFITFIGVLSMHAIFSCALFFYDIIVNPIAGIGIINMI